MTREVIWESVKEPLRLLVLAVIPLLVVYFGGLSYEWAAALVVALRFVDKLLHNLGKEQENELLTRGLTRF
jgi:hypothetical protein